MKNLRFGELLKDLRIRAGYTLREFCQMNGFDPGNMSKVERGLLPPPSHEKLETIAQSLKLKQSSPERESLFDVAAMEAGQLPRHILDNEQLLQKLPVFLRTINNKKLTPEKLDELIEKLKNA
jgi:transcriptional regulator with XRE-family HTH domain